MPEMSPVLDYRPTPNQVRYLEAQLALIADGTRPTHAAIGDGGTRTRDGE